MSAVYALISLQALLGAIDNLWHHEISEQLPKRRAAAAELGLHAARELLYGFIFLALAWFRWQGAWALLIALAFALEIVITLADFVVEDRTRRLAPFERVLHGLMAVNYGAVLALLAPVLYAWLRVPAGVMPVSHPFSWAFTVLGIGVLGWSARNAGAVLRLHRPAEWVRSPIHAATSPAPRTVLVSGATGFIGGHLVRRLISRGDQVIVLTRRPEVALDRFGPHVRSVTTLDEIDSATRVHAIVNLAGASIMSLPWTRARRRALLESRIETTRALIALLGRLQEPARVFVSASAIGFYGPGGDELIDEHGRPGAGFASDLCQVWEGAARAAARLGVRLVRLRIGFVLGIDGGALPPLLRSARLGLGFIIGSGRHWISWIHVDDLVRLIELALDTPRLSGAVNAVAPNPVRQRLLAQTLARALRRPLWLRVPAALLRTVLGERAMLLVEGQRAVPARVQNLDFRFRYPQLQSALAELMRRPTVNGAPAEVYFNGDCPICSTEMSHYAQLCAGVQPQVRFVDALRAPDGFASCGLRREHLERRVYLRIGRGETLSGLPALMALWSVMPGYRVLARILSLPALKQIAVALYDHVVAPTLARWASRHSASRAGEVHMRSQR